MFFARQLLRYTMQAETTMEENSPNLIELKSQIDSSVAILLCELAFDLDINNESQRLYRAMQRRSIIAPRLNELERFDAVGPRFFAATFLKRLSRARSDKEY